jgi:hypothetical protein
MKDLRNFIKRTIREFIEEQQLNEGLFDRFKKNEIFKQNPNIWTHTTYSEELINHLKSGGDFIGKKEDLSKFNVPDKGSFATSVNQHSPNFKKGSIFHGFELHPYLITTDLPDDAFQPNWNSKNYDNFNDSQNIGVLKPGYRGSENFKLWKKNKNNEFELIK